MIIKKIVILKAKFKYNLDNLAMDPETTARARRACARAIPNIRMLNFPSRSTAKFSCTYFSLTCTVGPTLL